jgi:hypothetical protein
MNNTIVYLIGAAAADRAAVAGAIAELTGARVVDTQAIYAPIFNVVPHEHVADLPDAVWAGVDAVREAVLHTIETVSPRDWSFVFTHAGLAIPADVGSCDSRGTRRKIPAGHAGRRNEEAARI